MYFDLIRDLSNTIYVNYLTILNKINKVRCSRVICLTFAVYLNLIALMDLSFTT